jgi:hypothetical protein
MRTITFSFPSFLPPWRVLEAAHDFTDRRSDVFPAVEAEHFEVHSIADNHADVTEGTRTGIGTNWERCRYDWSNPGSVTAAVTDSNVYVPGSSWTITAVAAPQGSHVEMTWARQFKPGSAVAAPPCGSLEGAVGLHLEILRTEAYPRG